MKKIIIITLSLFFVLILLNGIIQSPWAKEKALSFLTKSIKNSGWRINIENVRTTFPKIDLENVTIETDAFAITFGTLKADLSLLRLLKNEIFLSEVKGDRVEWVKKESPIPSQAIGAEQQSPSSFFLNIHDFKFTNVTIYSDVQGELEGSFSLKSQRKKGVQIHFGGTLHPQSNNLWLVQDLRFSSRIVQNFDRTWSIEKFKLDTDVYNIKGFGTLDAQGAIHQASIQIQSDQLLFASPIPASGRLFAYIDLHRKGSSLLSKTSWRIPNLEIGSLTFYETQGTIESLYESSSITGDISFNTLFLKHPWEGKTSFSWAKEDSLHVSDISIQSPILQAEGDLSISPEGITTGKIDFASPQLHELYPPIYGKSSGKIAIQTENQTPLIHFDLHATDFFFGALSAKGIRIYSDLINPLGTLEGTILCDIEQGKWGTLTLDSASIETTKEGENWPFQFYADGRWQHPLNCEMNGFWNYQHNDLLISLQNTTGSFFNHPLVLASPANFEWTPNLFRLTNFTLNVADASISLLIDRQGSNANAKLSIQKLPIDFLSINPLDVAIDGIFNLEITVNEEEKKLTGELSASVENVEMLLLGQTQPLTASGTLNGAFNRDRLDVKGALSVRETPLIQLDLSLPVHFEIWPFETSLLKQKNANGHFYLSGRVEEFLDFFNLGTHRIEGNCLCDLRLSNTLDNPHLIGNCDFSDAYYQNYFTGTELHNIQARFQADKTLLNLLSLSAQDSQKKGTFDAKGSIALLPKKQFPFQFNVNFTRFNSATFDLVTAESDGTLQIKGDLKSAIATGHLNILESDITIPSRIPRSIPHLEVIYKNAIAPPSLPIQTPYAAYPLQLDLTVDAPDGIFISGRGLESEWKGTFHIQGTQTNPASTGKIELIKGVFLFSGREFKLTEGSLTFSGEENAMPVINLAANIEIKDISITAYLKGPLNNPQITLQSSPPLPMGTIMAYLLFGQDLADISSSQALKLASSIASIAGDGPGILEQTKKSIGIDRIQIITVPSATAEGGETMAIQVGKYVAEGVLVSFSQGAENSSSNISIEVDVQGGLTFILESDQAQEQGKFTFRWSKTY